MILSECPELREVPWRCAVIDEAHRLKNRHCKLLDSLKHMDLEHKVLLTGTPLQNTVEELFSLLHFLEPSQFPSEAEFLKDFGDLKTEEQVGTPGMAAPWSPMGLRAPHGALWWPRPPIELYGAASSPLIPMEQHPPH
ncbi:hypothetical protein AAES_62825 [Amazona aestiva]|uniref:Helicase ATP-binding domain-containing protein n=1 Tax=Amazona aestiva TaxID=12930 RepID=A0A0Q3UT29_AMAAE|nr:hypothetical protein AAES_62825 [Amazona aestiva]